MMEIVNVLDRRPSDPRTGGGGLSLGDKGHQNHGGGRPGG